MSEQVATQEHSTALTVIERAKIALKSVKTEQDFNALVEGSRTIVEITNSDGYKQCHSARMSLVRARTTLTALDESVREDLVATNKAIVAERKRLAAIIEPEEKRLEKLQKAYDERIAAEKRSREEAEARRVATIKERIDDDIRGAVVGAAGMTAAEIARIIADVEAIIIDETFAEFREQAEGAKATTLMRLKLAHKAAADLEEKQRQLEAERAELARQRAEQDIAAAKERERLAEEQRQARKAAEAEAARQAEQLRRQRAEQEAAAQAERARLAEEARQIEARRQEQEANEQRQREEREAEERRLAEERTQLEREQEALRAQQQAQARSETSTTDAPVEVAVTPAPSADVIGADFAWSKPARPADEAILEVLSQAFSESRETVLEWLRDMDLNALERTAA